MLMFASAAFAEDPFTLPTGTIVLAKDDSGKTWRQNGVVTGSVEVVHGAFSNNLVKAGYACRHVIPLEKNRTRLLQEWHKGKQSLLLMLWPGKNRSTLFSWGTSDE